MHQLPSAIKSFVEVRILRGQMRKSSILAMLSSLVDLVQQVHNHWRKHGLKKTLLRIVYLQQSDLSGVYTLLLWLLKRPWQQPNADEWFDDVSPDVSIIILNYNQARITLACLESIWEHTVGYRYEIIVVDNGSSRLNANVLKLVRGRANVVFLNTNRYFGEGNNIGAEFANAPILVFMNNDIIVHKGWLAPLIKRLESPEVGGVGPRFIYPDGRLQEAGAFIKPDGVAVQRGKFGDPWAPEYSVASPVDYISAATLAVRLRDFEGVLGFDLAFEPAYYEDTDLCMKIRALGMQIWYEPGATVTHIESVTSSNPRHGLKLHNIVDLNRLKFCAKWEQSLARSSSPSTMPFYEKLLTTHAEARPDRPTLALFSPFPLTPGGGERYLLAIAQAMAAEYSVCLVTPEKWSRLRILTLAEELGLDLADLQLTPTYEIGDRTFDVFVAMGNSIIPPVASMGKINIYHCQFPFPTHPNVFSVGNKFWAGYDWLVVNSEFTRSHCLRNMADHRLNYREIQIISPPVAMNDSKTDSRNKALSIVNIGRFISDAHCKRQDTLISVFRKLTQESGIKAELHLVGSVHPGAQHRDYLLHCMKLAEGLPVHFHLNASLRKLRYTLQTSLVYWHGTGYGIDVNRDPSKCEHFGISVVEAMSAGCIAMAVRNGGPCETIEDAKSGFLWSDTEELRSISERVLRESGQPWVSAMSAAATERAQAYSDGEFRTKWRNLIKQAVTQSGVSHH